MPFATGHVILKLSSIYIKVPFTYPQTKEFIYQSKRTNKPGILQWVQRIVRHIVKGVSK